MTRGLLWAALAGGSVLSLTVCAGVGTQSIVLGSAAGNWVYPYVHPFAPASLGVLLLGGAVVAALLAAPPAATRTGEWLLVVAWVAAAFAVQALLRSQTPHTFGAIFASDGANSFFSVARDHSMSSVIAEFDRLRDFWPGHARVNMPGKIVLVSALMQISARPDVLAWLVVAVSNLGGPLVYLFARDLFADRAVALSSLVLYLFVPGKLFFFPMLNTVTPTVVLLCACLLLRWLMTGRAVYAACLGVALYGLVFFEPLPLVMGLLFTALIARAVSRGDIAWRTVMRQGGTGVAAFAVTYGVMLAWFGFDLFYSLRQIGADAVSFNDQAHRPYAAWVTQNMIDFMLATGVCQAVLIWAALGDGVLGATADGSRLTQPIVVLGLGLVGILLVTDLIGVNRGEATRLWIFLACFFQIPAAWVCRRLKSRAALASVLSTTLLLDAVGTSTVGFILP